MSAYPINIIRNIGRPTAYENILLAYAVEVAQWTQNYMLNRGRIATGDSIRSFQIIIDKNDVLLYTAASVGYALQGRTGGAFPNIDDLEKWVIAKPITPYPDENGRTPSLKQLVYLIGRSIALHGTKEPKLKPQNINMVTVNIAAKYTQQLGEAQADRLRAEFIANFNRQRAYTNKVKT